MERRLIGALALAAALLISAVAASAGSSAPDRQAATKLVVWLQNDAESGWKDVVAATNNTFRSRHSDVEVDVQYQTWGDHLTKFDAAIAGGNAPDVIEFGNTETTRYMASRLLQDLTTMKRTFPNSSTWLKALTDSCTYNGRLYCVPYYAGARAVIYRKDQYRAAGVRSTPKSLAQFQAAGLKLMRRYGKQRNYSALYFPGRYVWGSMSFVYDYGGQIAVRKGGKWQGTLHSPQAIRGLTKLKQIVTSLSRANKTGDEANPQQALVFSKGRVGSFIGNGWEWPYALDAKVGNPSLASKIGAYPMPSHVKGKFMPTFLGGSDLAVPVTSRNKSLAYDWIRIFTGNTSMRQLAVTGGVIPNSTSLTSINAKNPKLAPFAAASKSSWFVPTAPNWVKVENARVLQTMLGSIFTGRSSVAKAAKRASDQITRILNQPTT
ncbi:MAG TPA: extracellular solute-binding protein [Gaiellaceae bacterium]|nr:extracellular solute-binding protein [Gaiellaceae bacterium]